jgi:hypothetical protein
MIAQPLSNWGPKMRKIADPSHESFDVTVSGSLCTIRATHVRLHLLKRSNATEALLASQIELYGVLLHQISGIQTRLARDLKRTRLIQLESEHPSLNA